MFFDFFQHLRARGVPVGLQEWMTLMEALQKGLADESLAGFYALARCIAVKREGDLDLYDRCFAEYFEGVEAPPEVKDELEQWLKDAKLPRALSADELARLKSLDLDELRRQFEERMREQKERHDGGNRWVGTGGTSPFGHGGFHPSGIRVHGEGGARSAIKVAAMRRFRNLRTDVVLDTRQLGLALKRLRKLAREGVTEELDLDATIAATAKNAGDIDLVFHASRKNTVKLALLMDVGGSMTMHTMISERLFSAAHGLNHFKEFRCFYFHNCPYDLVYTDMARRDGVRTLDVLKDMDDSWHLMVVGDAAMSPYELTVPGGCIDYAVHNDEPGLVWLDRLKKTVPRSVWLNPEPAPYWALPSTQLVRRVFPEMYELTLAGLESAIEQLARR